MVPLIPVVGFLGAGKTTFLKDIIPLLIKKEVRPHVVINDFQNARVDAIYFKDIAETITPINGSCVCCGSFEELIRILHELKVAVGDVVLLESNGVTDSITLIENLSLRKECQRYTKPLQISIVDTKSWQKRHGHDQLESEQISTASFIHLSKTTHTSKKRMDTVRKDIRVYAPHAEIMKLESIANELVKVVANVNNKTNLQYTVPNKPKKHAHNHTKYHFNSWESPLPASVIQKNFYRKLKQLPEQVIRAKGIVRIKDLSNQKFIFQKVEEDILVKPVSESHEIEPLIICIGSNLPTDKLQSLFR
ncbi:MAG: GTP-binding protein [Verrucomicrobiota bacterium]